VCHGPKTYRFLTAGLHFLTASQWSVPDTDGVSVTQAPRPHALWRTLFGSGAGLQTKSEDDAERAWTERARSWTAAGGDCVALEMIVPGQRCRVAGVVRRLWIDPLGHTIEATICDGTGSLRASWAMPEPPRVDIRPGSGLILEGEARIDRAARLSMVEPAFEVASEPELN
jgi:hypothetical protein